MLVTSQVQRYTQSAHDPVETHLCYLDVPNQNKARACLLIPKLIGEPQSISEARSRSWAMDSPGPEEILRQLKPGQILGSSSCCDSSGAWGRTRG